MKIRKASLQDLKSITAVEAACFPPAEAASEETLRQRLSVFPDCFWLLEDEGRLAAFVDGMISDESILRDEMFARAELHQPDGKWQMIFGVDTLPEYRRQGCAGTLLKRVIADARSQGRSGVVLTCKDRLIPYYSKFGFKNEGLSKSVHGGAVWYDMRLSFGDLNGTGSADSSPHEA